MKKSMRSFLLFIVCVLAGATTFSQEIRGTYAIKNVETGMLLRVKDANKKDGTPLVAYTPVNWKCMTWDFEHVEGQTYRLKNLFTGKTFQPGSTPADSVSLVQMPFGKDELQQYEFVSAGENRYYIRLKGTALYLTPADKDGSTNSAIILAKKANGTLQQWTIYEQHPTM
ncbi:MAG TPA: RICIN domain-containing protein [Flavisolibacter sp.]|nr:RICIN domain-containing protein [Flavisolibacter sp.]